MIIKYTLNRNALTKEEQTALNGTYRGLTATRDTLTETYYDDNGELTYSSTYYIYKGSWTPYGACVLHNNRYVFARWSRYDAVNINFTDFAIDCTEFGNDDNVFTTLHYRVENHTVKY